MAKTEGERGPFASWVVRNRKRLYGTNLEQLSAALEKSGAPATITTIRGWEAGSRPRPEARQALERLFGEPAPDEPNEGDLAAAIREQSRAIQALADAIQADRERVSPAALRAFLQQLAAEGLLLIPGTPANTGESRQPAGVKR
jgi:hypothetical protein